MTSTYEIDMIDGEKITVEGVTEVKQVYGFLEFRNAAYSQIISIRAELIRSYGIAEPEVISPRVVRKTVTRSRRN